MYDDETIVKWIDMYGNATSFNFIVYGIIKEGDINMLMRGVMFQLLKDKQSYPCPMLIVTDEINEEKAVAMKAFQGTSVSFVFGGEVLMIEDTIKKLVSDGLDYLRFKNEYLGYHLCDSHV